MPAGDDPSVDVCIVNLIGGDANWHGTSRILTASVVAGVAAVGVGNEYENLVGLGDCLAGG